MIKCKGVMVWLGFRLGNKRALPENELCFGRRTQLLRRCPGAEAKMGAQGRGGAGGACRERKQMGSGSWWAGGDSTSMGNAGLHGLVREGEGEGSRPGLGSRVQAP